MAACDIRFEIKGAANWSEIQKKFKSQREEDRSYNGHQDGYSGDFQTVHEVKDHTHKIFDSFNEAHQYCMSTAQKWDFVVAVRYRSVQYKPSAKVTKLQTKIGELTKQLTELDRQPVKLAKFVTCEGCRSKVSTEHLRGSVECPVCREGDFRPLGLQRKLVKLENKIKELETKLSELKSSERTKQLAKSGTVNTLVAGWGAS